MRPTPLLLSFNSPPRSLLRLHLHHPYSLRHQLQKASYTTAISRTMAQQQQQQQYRLKLDSLDMKNFEKREAEVEGVEGAKVLLLKVGDQIHALGSKCTHYGAPLVKGVVTPDGRLTCPWHGGIHSYLGQLFRRFSLICVCSACFAVATGDVEDSPALDPLMKYPLTQKDGSMYITTDEASLKAGRRTGDVECKVESDEKVVIVGG